MIAQEAKQPNLFMPCRLLRAIPFSRACPPNHRRWCFRALPSLKAPPRFHLGASLPVSSPRRALSQPRRRWTDVFAGACASPGLARLLLRHPVRGGIRLGGKVWRAKRIAPGVQPWSHGEPSRCPRGRCGGERGGQHVADMGRRWPTWPT